MPHANRRNPMDHVATRGCSAKIDRRAAMRAANWNAAIWAIGNGLAGTTLVVYLARQLGADGIAVSWIVAAPQLAGVLRLFAPALSQRWGDRKRFCIAIFVASGVALAALPLVCAPGVLPTTEQSLVALVVLWCVYHLFEYLATVALWSWIGDLTPRAIRGRFIGGRERALTLARIAGLLIGSQIADQWKAAHAAEPTMQWIGYAIAAGIGALFMIGAVAPLVRMPDVSARDKSNSGSLSGTWATCAAMLAPLGDRQYRPLLMFGCWFSFCNGLAQAPQYLFHTRVLDLALTSVVVMQTVMRLGQSAVSPTLGRIADRGHSTAMMMWSQAIVASSTLFFYVATPSAWLWFAGAHLAWIAYAGLNVGLPRAMLNLSTEGASANPIAAYFAVSGVVFAAGSLIGGYWFEQLAVTPTWMASIPGVEDRYDLFFLGSAVLRVAGIFWIARIVDPITRR
jgi:hypothetical protein